MMQVPLSAADITEKEIEIITRVLTTPYLSIGLMIKRFEETWPATLGVDTA